MKNRILLSSHSETRRASARSIICRRGGVWPGLLLAACCALLTGLAHPARAAVTEAWVHRYNNAVTNANDLAFKVVHDAVGDIIVIGSSTGGMLTIKYSGADGALLPVRDVAGANRLCGRRRAN